MASSTFPALKMDALLSRGTPLQGVAPEKDRNRELPIPAKRPTIVGPNADEDGLLKAFQAGDVQAFGLLVHRYQNRLYSALVRFLQKSEDARDVLQDTFVSAFTNAKNFKGNSRFYTWMYRIAMNHAIDLHRRKKPRQTLSIYSEDQTDLMNAKLETQPVNQLEREEDRQLIQRALALLSPEHRAVLVMKEIDDLRYEEIAEVLEVPVGTVRSRLHRARMEMKDILEKLQS